MNWKYRLKHLDKGEKDFLLVALAFLLILIFVFTNSSLFEKKEKYDVIKFGSLGQGEIDISELQAASCRYAQEYGSCDKLESTNLISKEICCKKRGECCG